MDHYTVGKIVSNVLWSKLSSKHLTVPDHDRFLDMAVKFRERWDFPNVIGCVDGKHICIKCPTKAGSLFCNYKQFFSVVLQGVAHSESTFIFIDIGAYGKQSVGCTFPASTLQHFLEEYESTLPKARGELSYLAPLGSENISAPYFKQCFFQGGGIVLPPRQSNTTLPSPKTVIKIFHLIY